MVQMFKMADDSSAVPIWCDVGKNLNAAYLIVSLRDVTKGKPSDGGNSKKIVKIYSRHLTFNSHVVSASVDGDTEDKNTVLYPGKYLFLLFKSSVEDANELAHAFVFYCLNCGEISYFSSVLPQILLTVVFASMISLIHE